MPERNDTRATPETAVADTGPAPAARPGNWYSPSALVLIAVNLLPLYGVLVLGWAVFPVMLLYWLENVVIGVLNVVRMLFAARAGTEKPIARLVLVPFFCVHYGLFAAAHGLVVFSIFGDERYNMLIDGLWTGQAALQAIRDYALWPALAALAASHLFSLLWNYLGRGEFRHARIAVLMQAPYLRVIVLHVTLIAGGLLIELLASPLWALLVLIALKIGIDLRAHLREHRRVR